MTAKTNTAKTASIVATIAPIELVGRVTYRREFDWGTRIGITAGPHTFSYGVDEATARQDLEPGALVRVAVTINYRSTKKSGWQHLLDVLSVEVL